LYRTASGKNLRIPQASPRIKLEKDHGGFQTGLYSTAGSIFFETRLQPLRHYGARDTLPARLQQNINVFIQDREKGVIEVFTKEQTYPVNHLHYMVESAPDDGRDRGPYRFLNTFLGIELEEFQNPMFLSSLSSSCIDFKSISPADCMIRLPSASARRPGF
jgi:hypothetical protein